MTARPVDLAPPAPVRLPESGLGRGWEAATLMGLTLLILSFGLVTLYSASSVHAVRQGVPDHYFVLNQVAGAGVGLGLLVVTANLPYRVWRHLAWPLMAVSSFLLLLCLLPWTHGIAPEINGARRWLRIGVGFQPSEIAKIAVIVWTAATAVRKADQFRSLRRGLGPFLVVWAVPVTLVAAEPDLSTAVVIALLGLVVVFAAGARIAHFLFLGLFLAPLVHWQLQLDYRIPRIQEFLAQISDPTGTGYQVRQSLVAFGSGGLSGVGIGEGRQKYGFLPEAHNDFIFAMVGEEWGFVGVLALVALYVFVVLIGFRIASRAPDLFGELVAVGCASFIALHAILHMAVGLALAPATGLALPLVSYGRSNLVVTFVALGILISVARAGPGGKAVRG